MLTMIDKPYLKQTEHGIVTTSRVVAQHFGKRHSQVLRDIDELLTKLGNASATNFGRQNFYRLSYPDAHGQHRPMYEMTGDGLMLLATGFTGNKVLAVKVRYIEAFNAVVSDPSLTSVATLDYRVLAPLFDDLHSSTRTALVLGYFLNAPITHPGGWHKVSTRKLGKRLAFTHPQAAIYRVQALRERGFLVCKPERPDRKAQTLLYRVDRGAILSAAQTLPQSKYEGIAAWVSPPTDGVARLQ